MMFQPSEAALDAQFWFLSGSNFSRALKNGKRIGLKRVCETPFPNSVPQGRLNLAQDASPGLI
jgi:hypothetical protein